MNFLKIAIYQGRAQGLNKKLSLTYNSKRQTNIE